MANWKYMAVALVGVIVGLCGISRAQETGMSLNREILLVPAPGPVTIDGDVKDWDLSAGVWSYNTPTITDSFSVWTHMMWDAKGVYFLARFADKTPMTNVTMGKDFANSWKSDCYQARVVFDDHTPDEHQMHINMFYSSSDQKPFMIVKHGGFGNQNDETGPDRPDLAKRFGPDMEKAGGKIAVVPAKGGYTMEAFWPWSYVRLSGKPLAAGESFVFGLEGLWGDSTGAIPSHRLADGIKDAKVNRIFMFFSRDGWGSAVLQEKGQLNITAQQRELHAARLKEFVNYDTVGSIPIKYDLPDDREVTIAIDDAKGVRVRNLIGQYPRQSGTVTDLWDGLDDAGKPVPAGTYTAQVLDHQPITLRLFNSLYNAATPPWATDSSRKIWGANHGHPTSVAIRGDVILVSFTGVEGATGLLRCGPDGIIQWCVVPENADVCMDDKFAYTISREADLRRYNLTTGQLIPFDDALRSPEIRVVPRAVPNESSMACVGGKLFIMVAGDKLYRINAATGAVEGSFAVANLCAVTSYKEKLTGVFADATVAELNADGVRGQTIIQAKGVAKPVRVTIGADGRLAITDRATNRVLVFGTDGNPLHAVGAARAEADRPAGKFIETDLANPMGAAFDKQGRLWIAEASSNSKRVTVWSDKGELQQSFWGAADYGGMAAFPITFDSTRFVAHGVEFQLDPKADPKTRPTAEKPLIYHPELAKTRGMIYRYKDHEYAVTAPGNNEGKVLMIAKRDADGVFRSCVQLRPQAHYWSVGWVRPDLTIITPDQKVYPLQGLSSTGVPLYDFKKPVTPANKVLSPDGAGATSTYVMDNAGNISDGIHFNTVDGRSGAYPNRYGRHDAPAAQRGVLIAPFRTNGVVEDVPGAGAITALGGDRGQWFLLTMDGLYISSILQDIKDDVTLDETLTGGESFGGFIWRDEKNRVLVQVGGISYRLLEVLGLETCRKQQLKLVVTSEQIQAGQKIAAAGRSAADTEVKQLTIAKVAALPTDAVAADLPKDQPLLAGVPEVMVKERGNFSHWWRAALAHDGKDLVIVWQVADASPWKNAEGRFTHAFMGGDCVDVKVDVPGRGLLRVLVAPIEGKDTVVYFQEKAAVKGNPVTYVVGNNAGNATSLDVVKRLSAATATSKTAGGGYSVTLRVPLAELGLDVQKVSSLKGVIGVIYSDPTGTNRVARLYWSDKQTDQVSDVPSEARIEAARFGPIMIGK